MEAPEGWYPDPQAEADERFWDGSTWTDRTRSAASAQPAVSAAPGVRGTSTKTVEQLLTEVVHEIRMIRYLIIVLYVVIVVVPTAVLFLAAS